MLGPGALAVGDTGNGDHRANKGKLMEWIRLRLPELVDDVIGLINIPPLLQPFPYE